jgi:hypothetical protein
MVCSRSGFAAWLAKESIRLLLRVPAPTCLLYAGYDQTASQAAAAANASTPVTQPSSTTAAPAAAAARPSLSPPSSAWDREPSHACHGTAARQPAAEPAAAGGSTNSSDGRNVQSVSASTDRLHAESQGGHANSEIGGGGGDESGLATPPALASREWHAPQTPEYDALAGDGSGGVYEPRTPPYGPGDRSPVAALSASSNALAGAGLQELTPGSAAASPGAGFSAVSPWVGVGAAAGYSSAHTSGRSSSADDGHNIHARSAGVGYAPASSAALAVSPATGGHSPYAAANLLFDMALATAIEATAASIPAGAGSAAPGPDSGNRLVSGHGTRNVTATSSTAGAGSGSNSISYSDGQRGARGDGRSPARQDDYINEREPHAAAAHRIGERVGAPVPTAAILPRRRALGVGLENLGNTCFMNSTLQCLGHLQPYQAWLYEHRTRCRYDLGRRAGAMAVHGNA